MYFMVQWLCLNFEDYLNRFLLTVICCPIYHWLEVSREMDISQAWARFYFDSNTQETTEMQVYPCDVFSFPPLHEKKSRQLLDCNRGIYMYFVSFCSEKTTFHRPTLWKWKLTSPSKSKRRHSCPCSDLLQNNSLQFSNAAIGTLC